MRLPSAVRAWAPRLLGAILIAWAGVVLWRQLAHVDWRQVGGYMRAWGPWRLAAASGLAALGFALVAVIEWLGLRWSGVPLPWRTAALRSFMVNGLIHSLGANIVTATLTRTWVYRRAGVRLVGSAATTVFVAVSMFAGLGALVGVALLSARPEQLQVLRFATGEARLIGALLLGAVAAYLAACAAWPKARLFADVRLPEPAYAAAQVGIGMIDNLVSATLLWLLVGRPAPPYPAFVVGYVLAYLAGAVASVPGGVGVFEASLFLLLPHSPRASLAAGFLGFRLIFYLAPLIAALLLVVGEALSPPRRGAALSKPRPRRRCKTPGPPGG